MDIAVADIANGNLKFDPIDNTDTDSSFNFKVSDGVNWSDASYSVNIIVTRLLMLQL